jgi:hypothetical protein
MSDGAPDRDRKKPQSQSGRQAGCQHLGGSRQFMPFALAERAKLGFAETASAISSQRAARRLAETGRFSASSSFSASQSFISDW